MRRRAARRISFPWRQQKGRRHGEPLEKLARALENPMHQPFYGGAQPPKVPNLLTRKSSDDIASGSSGKDEKFLNKLRRLLARTLYCKFV
jgi:hypothetical protein